MWICADDHYIYFFFFTFPTSLSYSHILHTVLEHKWRCCFDLNELQANTTGPVCTGPYTRMELCSREGSVCKDGLGSGWSCSHQQNPILYYSASAAVTRKGQFLLSLLTVSNVLIRQKNLSLLSGSTGESPVLVSWAQRGLAVHSVQVLGNHVLSSA